MLTAFYINYYCWYRLLKGRSFPGKVLITRTTDPIDYPTTLLSPGIRSPTDNNSGPTNNMDHSVEVLVVLMLILHTHFYPGLFIFLFLTVLCRKKLTLQPRQSLIQITPNSKRQLQLIRLQSTRSTSLQWVPELLILLG